MWLWLSCQSRQCCPWWFVACQCVAFDVCYPVMACETLEHVAVDGRGLCAVGGNPSLLTVLCDATGVSLPSIAHLIISPLWKVDATERELEAIESEFERAKTSDANRRAELLCAAALPGHPIGNFTWGSRASLQVRGVPS